MARSPPVENLIPQFVWLIIKYCSNTTETTQWAAPSCNRPHPATDYDISDGTYNRLAVTPHHLQGNTSYASHCKCATN